MIIENKGRWKHRVIVGTPVTGLVRIEWAERRWGQINPTNWSLESYKEAMSTTMPLRFQVADAQNLIVKRALEGDFEWLFLVEQDNVLPMDAFLRINQYMIKKTVPVVSGLYFTKSVPPEPIAYREWGGSYYTDWKLGDKFWVRGVPMGCCLIHTSILRAMWEESPEYLVGGQITRRIYEEPAHIVFNRKKQALMGETGTSDLEWCRRVVEDDFFTKAGWPKYAKKKYPFMIDSNLFCGHIDNNGRNFPLSIPPEFIDSKRKSKKDADYFTVVRGEHGENG